MRRAVSIIAFLLLPGCAPTPEQLLLGRWVEETSSSAGLVLEFNDGGAVTVSGDTNASGTYVVAFEQKPAHLGLVLDGKPLLTILEFLDDDTIRMEEPRTERPTSFGAATKEFRRSKQQAAAARRRRAPGV